MAEAAGAEQAPEEPPDVGTSVYDVLRPGPRNRGMAQLRAAVRSASTLVWASTKGLLTFVIGMQVLMAVLLLIQVFLGRAVLNQLLDADSSGEISNTLIAMLVAMAVVTSAYA